MLNRKFKKPDWLKSDYDFAREQYLEAKHNRDKTLQALGKCYDALALGTIHGKEEHSILVKIKQLNGVLFNNSIDLAKAERKLNIVARSKR